MNRDAVRKPKRNRDSGKLSVIETCLDGTAIASGKTAIIVRAIV